MVEQHFACIRQRGWRQPLEELRQEHEIQRRLGAVVQQLSHREPDGARKAPQKHDRAVAFAGLELGEVALGHPCMRGQRLARHAALVAQGATALAEAAQIGIAAATVGTDTFHRYSANMHYSAKQGANRRLSTGKERISAGADKKSHVFWAKMKQTADDFEIGQFPHYTSLLYRCGIGAME